LSRKSEVFLKQCTVCREYKDEGDYYSMGPGKRRPDCKDCFRRVKEKYRKKNLEKVRAIARESARRARQDASVRARRAEEMREYRRRKKQGLTLATECVTVSSNEDI
jgi:hypothetical protein